MVARSVPLRLRRGPWAGTAALRGWPARGLFWVAVAAIGWAIGGIVANDPQKYALGLSLLILATWLCARRPAVAFAVVLVLMGFSQTITVYTPVPVHKAVELVMLGLLLSVAWNFLMQGRERSLSVWPGLALVGVYLAITLLQIPLAASPAIGIEAFRAAPAYVLAFLVVALAPWSSEVRWRMVRAVVVVAALVGAYAVFRLIAGPAEAERLAIQHSASSTFDYVSGKLALFGSFGSRQALGGWAAVAIPFCFAFALGARGRWRALALGAIGLSFTALLASQSRTALVGVVIGVVFVFLLYAIARAQGRVREGTAVATLTGSLTLALIAITLTLSASQSQQRFEGIFRPSKDPSGQAHLQKWRAAVSTIKSKPLGAGLGSAGTISHRYSRFVSVNTFDIDNSYLEIAYQQGVPVLVLLVAALLTLVYNLCIRAISSFGLPEALIGFGAAGALTSWLVLLGTGAFVEGWQALLTWLMLGLAVSLLADRRPRPHTTTMTPAHLAER